MKKTYKPTAKVAKQAEKGLKLWNEHGRKCATPVGVKRAHQLSKREEISFTTVVRMFKFFNRHYKNRKNAPPKCGEISWLLWGGDAGYDWAADILEKEEYFY